MKMRCSILVFMSLLRTENSIKQKIGQTILRAILSISQYNWVLKPNEVVPVQLYVK